MIDRDPHHLWQELLTTALVGTGRRPVVLPAPGMSEAGALGDLLARLEGREPEAALLGAAAALSLYRRAGQIPPVDLGSLPEPCEAEERPGCGARAGQHLALMLRGQYAAALPEWLAAVQAAGQRVPEERLPELLDRGVRKPELREWILPVLGRRGEWLIRQNPDWEPLAASFSNDEAAWETGTPVQRLTYLRGLRRHDPARARELLAATWDQEAPKERADLVGVLAESLGVEDEPFLEAALDDRRKEVRHAAVGLLARLPGSGLQRRMIERVQPLVALKRGLIGAARIEVTLPEACDAAMIRDGVEPKPPAGSLGEKAWWLAQILSFVPPAHWCDLWNRPPAELIRLAGQSEWKDALLWGWAQATARHADPQWAETLLICWFREGNDRYRAGVPVAALLDPLPPDRREALILEALSAGPGSLNAGQPKLKGLPAEPEPLHDGHPALWLLRSFEQTWSHSLSRAIIQSIRQRILRGAGRSQPIWELRASLPQIAARVPPALTEELSRGWPTEAAEWSAWADSVDRFLSLLQFRHEMLEALQDR